MENKLVVRKDIIRGIVIIGAFIIFLIIVRSLVSFNSDDQITTGGSSTDQTNEEPIVSNNSEVSSETTAVNAVPTEEEKNKDIVFNQSDSNIVINSIQYKINSVKISDKINTSFTKEQTDNQFIMISLTLTNKGDHTETITPTKFTLVGTNEKKYAPFDKSFFVSSDEMLYGVELNPDLTATKFVAFETAKGVIADKLQVFNDDQFLDEGKTYITLNHQ